MKKSCLPLVALVAMFSWPFVATCDEKKSDEKKKTAGVTMPAESEKWTIELQGFEGTLGDRYKYRWKVSHDGSFEFQSGQNYDPMGPLTKAKLTLDELHTVYSAVAEILTKPKKTSGRTEDGLCFKLTLKGDLSEKSLKFGEPISTSAIPRSPMLDSYT